MQVPEKIVLQIAATDIGQLTDFPLPPPRSDGVSPVPASATSQRQRYATWHADPLTSDAPEAAWTAM